MEITLNKSQNLKEKPQSSSLGFGKYFTDHMFVCDYIVNEGIKNAMIVPYGPISLDPSAMVLHYAQETFEGLKAYLTKEGKILLFRPEMNAKRFQNSNARLCMPKIEIEDFIKAIEEVIKVDHSWIPTEKGTSLYIRPFMFGYDYKLGVHAASKYKFMVLLSPVGSYYPNGLQPVNILIENELVRAVKGGTGEAKCGGNYAASILAQEKAEKLGFNQVLWLDGVQRKYIEEVGTMNVMFLINNEIITSPLDGSVLPGVTRDSMITILKDLGYKVNERQLSVDELMAAAHDGTLQEAFGTGTAAVISPIGKLRYKDDEVVINNGKIGTLSQKLYDTLTGIQNGILEDKFNWTREIKL